MPVRLEVGILKHMPNTPSAKKRVRQTKKRTARNKRVKRAIKLSVKTVEEKLKKAKNSEELKEELKKLQKVTDKAASKGIIHKNKAIRIKKRVSKKVKKVLQQRGK